jgi:acyl carrier protein
MRRTNGYQPTDVSPRRQLREFIETNLLYLEPDLEVDDADDLLALGVIDSLGFVELVGEVQARFGVTVEDIEITEENFGSIDAIAAFIEAKRAQ